jgi:hypothetical protein
MAKKGGTLKLCSHWLKDIWSNKKLMFKECNVVKECKNPRCHVAVATEFCMVLPDICQCLVWNVLHVTFPALEF